MLRWGDLSGLFFVLVICSLRETAINIFIHWASSCCSPRFFQSLFHNTSQDFNFACEPLNFGLELFNLERLVP
jgi:hypothetical protein